MATVVKRFTWDSDLESFTCNLGTLSAMQRDAANGYSGNGSIQGYESGNGAGSTGVGNASRSLSWEDMGVPAGAVVTAVQVTESRTYAGLTHSSGFGSASWLCTIASSAAGWSAQTLCSRGPITSADSSWNNGSGSSVSVPSGAQASNTVCQLVIQHTNVRATGTGTGTSTHTDYFTLTITYTPASTTHDIVLVLESTSSVAAIGSKRTVHDVTLSLEATSSVACEPLVSHAIHDIILALESTSTAAAEGSKTAGGTTHDITLALETTTSVVVQRVIVDGLVAEYVARLAKNGTAPGNNTDPTASWNDLVGSNDGALTGFGYTASSGWAGTGTPSDPYRLVFDAATDPYVELGDHSLSEDKTFTKELWIVAGAVAVTYYALEGDSGSGTANPNVGLYGQSDGTLRAVVRDNAGSERLITGTTALTPGEVYHVIIGCGTNVALYVNNVSEGTPGAPPAGTISVNSLKLGARPSTLSRASSGQGVATVRLYNRDLTADERAQNLKAKIDAFSGGVVVTHATHDVTLALESTSSVEAIGSKVAGGVTHDVVLALESVSSVAAEGSVVHATHDVTLALESVSAALVVGSVVHATHDVLLSTESLSAVVAIGSVTHATHDVVLALESGSTVEAVGSVVHATLDVVLALESVSAVVAVGSKVGAGTTYDVVLALESVTTVIAAGAVTHATHDVALALESTSTVVAIGSVVHATHDVALALESVSAVAAVGSCAHAVHDVVLALESASSVVAVGSVTHAVHDIALALESVSAVAVVGSVAGEVLVVLALESVSSVAVVPSVTHATHDVTLALEATSSVTAAGSVTHAVHDVTLALESTSTVTATGGQIHATWDIVLALESTSAVVVVGSVARAFTPDIDLEAELLPRAWRATVVGRNFEAEVLPRAWRATVVGRNFEAEVLPRAWRAKTRR